MSREWHEQEHPRWPAESPDSKGGEFAPTGVPGGDWVSHIASRIGRWRPATEMEMTRLVRQPGEYVGESVGGDVAATTFHRFGDTWAVHKAYGDSYADKADAEVAASLIGRAIGAPVATTIHDPARPGNIWMQYVQRAQTKGLAQRLRPEAIDEHDRLMLGLLDVLVANWDRHNGNWISIGDGHIVGIDHGEAFDEDHGVDYDSDGVAKPPVLRQVGFTGPFIRVNPFGSPRWKNNPLHPQDIETVRNRLAGLQAHFAHPALMSWYVDVHARLDALALHATGTERRIR